MNDLLLVLMGFCLGGSAFMVLAMNRIEDLKEDLGLQRIANSTLREKLAKSAKEIERLTEQTNDILNDSPDDADWWKQALK